MLPSYKLTGRQNIVLRVAIHGLSRKETEGIYMPLVDEVLAVGDESFQQKCKDLVSHTEEAVKNICDKARVLDHGRVVFFGISVEAIDRYHQLLAH